ncbi:nucleoside transporter-domain-containing protein [Crucibulum laeve]|uniref:Nucleoside transporter-domain-containing protein n=1 Tax=Crucibulum laeve TaxID=68775 RepID=A0A5C3MF27_9AGAR|nr:nucleoside transporter-domain-containing protein [Crucibulum laeve]
MARTDESPEALYHALPQSPDVPDPSDVELDGETADTRQPPSDPPAALVDSRVGWIHFILGCSVLLPWNVMITATPYFLSRVAGSPLRSTFSSYLSTSFTASNFIFLAHATATSKHSTPSRLTRVTILWLAALTFLLVISTFFVVSPGLFFAFVLLNGAVQATAGAYLQTAIVAVASLFGPLAVQAMMSGQAAVAVAVSGVQVLSAATSVWGKPRTYVSDGSAEERAAFLFFTLSTLFLLISAGAHAWLVSMPIYKTVAAPLERRRKPGPGTSDEHRGLVSGGREEIKNDTTNAIRVGKANLTYEIAVAYVFMVTLAVYPPITTSVQPTNPTTHPLLFSAVHFLVFNVGDLFGRYICSFPRLMIWSAKKLLTLSMARTLFVPLFLMCNIQRPSSTVVNTPIINSDFMFMLLLFFLGLSNGYVSSMCMMAAPSIEHNPRLKGRVEDVDVAATMASFCLVGGLALGSIGSFAVRAAVCGCNPFTE